MINETESIEKMLILSGKSRGYMIELCITLERGIDKIIAGHFCDDFDKYTELKDYIIAQCITAEAKRMILINILSRNYPEILKEHKKDLDLIGKLYEERNVLAHMGLDISKNAIEIFNKTQKISFIKYRTQVSNHDFSSKDISNFITKAQKCLLTLDIIITNSIFTQEEE